MRTLSQVQTDNALVKPQLDEEAMNTKPEVTFFVTFQAKPGMEEQAKQEVLELLRRVTQEPTCIHANFHQDLHDPTQFMLYENWAYQEAFQNEHKHTPHMQAFVKKSEEFMTKPMQFTFWRLLSEHLRS